MKTPFYRKCIQDELARRCEKNPRYSLRAFAVSVNISDGALSQIISGKRVPALRVSERLCKAIDLSPTEKGQFLSSLAETHRDRGLKRLNSIFRNLEVNNTPKELSIDLFKTIADWYHYAILEMTFVKGFQSSPQWIAKELGVTSLEAKLAIERLKSLELLTEDKGKLLKTMGHLATGDRHITTPALRKRQKQILEKAIYSLENDPIERRNMSAMTMAIDPKKIRQAKKIIDEFINNLCSFLESGERKEVYEFGTFLVPLQENRS